MIHDAELQAELAMIAAESIGWLPLEANAYVHVGNPDEDDVVVIVTGVPEAGMAGMNVVWVVG